MEENTNIEQFTADFNRYEYDFLVSKWVVEKLPQIFKGNYEMFLQTKLKLSKLLNVDSCSIVFVGSSCTGFSLSPAAGQSVFHCHMHVIPRYNGDVPNPKGGVRGVIPSKQKY